MIQHEFHFQCILPYAIDGSKIRNNVKIFGNIHMHDHCGFCCELDLPGHSLYISCRGRKHGINTKYGFFGCPDFYETYINATYLTRNPLDMPHINAVNAFVSTHIGIPVEMKFDCVKSYRRHDTVALRIDGQPINRGKNIPIKSKF